MTGDPRDLVEIRALSAAARAQLEAFERSLEMVRGEVRAILLAAIARYPAIRRVTVRMHSSIYGMTRVSSVGFDIDEARRMRRHSPALAQEMRSEREGEKSRAEAGVRAARYPSAEKQTISSALEVRPEGHGRATPLVRTRCDGRCRIKHDEPETLRLLASRP
jgi:hypothetical protein